MKRARTAPAAAVVSPAPTPTSKFDGIIVSPRDQLGQRAVYLNSNIHSTSTTTQASATRVLYSRIYLQPSRQTVSVGSCVHYFSSSEEKSKVGFVVRIQFLNGTCNIDNCELVLHDLIPATDLDNVFEQNLENNNNTYYLHEEESKHTISPQQITLVAPRIDFNSSSVYCNQVFTQDNYLQPIEYCRKFLFDEALDSIFPPPLRSSSNNTSQQQQTTRKPHAATERIAVNKKSKFKSRTSTSSAKARSTAGTPLHPKLSQFQISNPSTWTPQTVDWNL